MSKIYRKQPKRNFVYSHYYTKIIQISLLSRCRSLHSQFVNSFFLTFLLRPFVFFFFGQVKEKLLALSMQQANQKMLVICKREEVNNSKPMTTDASLISCITSNLLWLEKRSQNNWSQTRLHSLFSLFFRCFDLYFSRKIDTMPRL